MNAGITTAWVMVTAGILLATGWKKQLLDDIPALGAACAAAAFLAACGLAGSLTPMPAAAPQLVAFSCAGLLLRMADPGKRIQALAGALLGSIAWIWLRRLYAADPVFILWDAQLDGPLAAGVLAAAAAGHFRAQFPAAAAAAIAAYWLVPAPAGAWAWLDGFLASLFAARAVTLLARGALALAGRLRPHPDRGAE